MIFNIDDYINADTVKLQSIDTAADSQEGFILQINPSSIREEVRTRIEATNLINSNLPRQIVTGTNGRSISFTALLHGMEPEKIGREKFQSGPSAFLENRAEQLVAASFALVPFAANVVRGVKTVADILGKDGEVDFSIDGSETVPVLDLQINKLFELQVSADNRQAVKRVKIIGYPAFEGMDFYISEINIERRLWDNKLRTQFAEINITLIQVGSNSRVGKFFPNRV